MRFISVRDFRNQSAQVWQALAAERDLVITSSGKPIAILSAVDAADLEQSLSAMRRARAVMAVEAMQRQSAAARRSRMTPAAIQAEIRAVRKNRPL